MAAPMMIPLLVIAGELQLRPSGWKHLSSNCISRRWMKLQRNRTTNSVESEMRLESTNNTALLALGARKPLSGAITNLFTAPGLDRTIGSGMETGTGAGAGLANKAAATAKPAAQRTFVVRIKHVNVKDIIQFMEGEQRYARSKLLYDSYLNYKW